MYSTDSDDSDEPVQFLQCVLIDQNNSDINENILLVKLGDSLVCWSENSEVSSGVV